MKRTSIKDIAQIAQVSVATVSYVLNNKEGQKISEATKEKILKIAESINYKPNKIAKSLKTNKTKLLGLIVADISNEFYSTLARKLENKALKKGYTLIIGSSDENAEKFQMLIELFSQQQVDGLIIAPVAGSEAALNQLIKEEYPIKKAFEQVPTKEIAKATNESNSNCLYTVKKQNLNVRDNSNLNGKILRVLKIEDKFSVKQKAHNKVSFF